jgi:NAD(P)-dependent dehydrogenase (short-subunit alcohol dehydrogenase family)
MDRKLADRIAIVTGAAGGIGARCAERLAAEGATVIVADIDLAGAAGVADRIAGAGGVACALELDIGDESSIESLYAFVADMFGRLDILHNNAANLAWDVLRGDMAIESMDGLIWDATFTVNCKGTMLMMKHALPLMLKGGRGSIINTSSTAALLGDLANPAYASSKAALNCLTLYVAAQYGKRGIRCNAIAPGLILTPKLLSVMPGDEIERVRRHTLTTDLGTPDDIAATVSWLASDEARFVTGQIIAVDGGVASHLPFYAERLGEFSENGNTRRSAG